MKRNPSDIKKLVFLIVPNGSLCGVMINTINFEEKLRRIVNWVINDKVDNSFEEIITLTGG